MNVMPHTVSTEIYVALNTALEIVASPSKTKSTPSLTYAPAPNTPTPWPTALHVTIPRTDEQSEWFLPGVIRAELVDRDSGRSFILDRHDDGHFHALLPVGSARRASLRLDGVRSVLMGHRDYLVHADGILPMTAVPAYQGHFHVSLPQDSEVRLVSSEPWCTPIETVLSSKQGQTRPVHLKLSPPGPGRHTATVTVQANGKKQNIDITILNQLEPAHGRLIVFPESVNLTSDGAPFTITIRVEKSGEGELQGVVHVGTVPHPRHIDVTLSHNDTFVEHVLTLSQAELPLRAQGKLTCSLMTSSARADHRTHATEVTYQRVTLMRDVALVVFSRDRPRLRQVRITRSDGRPPFLDIEISPNLEGLVEVRPEGTLLQLRALGLPPAPTVGTIRLRDRDAGMALSLPVQFELKEERA